MIGLLYSAVRNVDVHNFQRFNEEQLEAVERMTSGKAINRASDDVASMGVLSKMQAEVLGSNQSIRNSNDAFSFAEVGDAALADCEEALNRMKELAIQSMNGANNGKDIQAIQKEFDHWKEVFAQVVENTEFAGSKILNDKSKWFQTNWKPTEVTTFDPIYLASDQVGSNKMVSDGTISNAAAAAATYSAVNNGITTNDAFILKSSLGEATINVSANQTAYSIANDMNDHTQTTGVRAEAVSFAKLSNLSSTGNVTFTLHGRSASSVSANITNTSELATLMNAINQKSNITGITAELTGNRSEIILYNDEGYDIGIEQFDHSADSQTMNVVGLQSDGTTASGAVVTLTDATAVPANTDNTVVGGHVIMKSHTDFTISAPSSGTALFSGASKTASFIDLNSATVDTANNASSAIDAIEGSLNKVVDTRSRFGQVMQRLQHNASGLQISAALVEQARSTHEDTDFAAEMVKMFRSKYMARTNLSVASITNNMSKTALQLI
ncbi:MAG: hypothetical protein HQK75_12635 [Candidatus Magnetomorum sp.]|nr:hypothetical protein [Candidatus Magnetomorum sp.]